MAIPINEDPYSFIPSIYDDALLDEMPIPTYRPESIAKICELTEFTKQEVKLIYRAFKQGFPTGIITLEQFQEMFIQFFPMGNPKVYAEYVFKTFDRDGDGIMNFEEFITGLSIISRGTILEKLEWIFNLYDVNRRGYICKSELFLVVQSIYLLVDRAANLSAQKHIIDKHVAEVFKKIDENDDGVVTRREFIDNFINDRALCDSLNFFDTCF